MQRMPLRPLLALLLFVPSTFAQSRTVWDGVYSDAQASRGQNTFAENCSRCHSLTADGRSPVMGDPFWKSFAQKTVGEMLQWLTANMPNGAPGSLSSVAYADIAAAILKSNGFPAGQAELTPAAVADVKILQKDGNTELPANSLVRVVGCLARSGSDWVVTSATTPQRAESATGDDAAKPLGNRTFTLKFVLTRLDAMLGSRVAVTGLLMGTGGADGINTTTVNRVAPKCP